MLLMLVKLFINGGIKIIVLKKVNWKVKLTELILSIGYYVIENQFGFIFWKIYLS